MKVTQLTYMSKEYVNVATCKIPVLLLQTLNYTFWYMEPLTI